MADESSPKKTANRKKGLPPLSPRNNGNEDESKPQVTRRKKKRPVQTGENGQVAGEGDKPTPRRRARSATPAGKAEDSGAGDGENNADATATKPLKKKKKPKPKPEGGDQGEEAPDSARSAPSVQEVRRRLVMEVLETESYQFRLPRRS